VPGRVVPIPKRKLKVVNIDLHSKEEKGLIPVPTPCREIIWVHPNIIQRSNRLLWSERSPKAKQKHLIAMWGVFLREKSRKVSLFSLTQKKRSLLSLLAKALLPCQELDQVCSTWNSTMSWWQIPPRQPRRHPSCPRSNPWKCKKSLLFQSYSKRQRGRIINSFPL